MNAGPEWRGSPARVSSRLRPSSTVRAPWPGRPAKVLAERHALPARHLEPLLQALVRVGRLKPRGGYELAHERRRVTADNILRAAGTIENASDPAATAGSTLLHE